MTAEMGSPLLPLSSPAYGTRGENEKKKSARHKLFGRSICIFCRDDELTPNVEMVNSRALEWRTVVWPFQHPNLYMQ